jgi:SAM-dependent methyltransferase
VSRHQEKSKLPFALDTPSDKWLNRLTRFGGWYMSDDGSPANSINLLLDRKPLFQLGRAMRPDVGAAFLAHPLAISCGFLGDVVMPASRRKSDTVSIAIEVELAGGERRIIHEADYCIREPSAPWFARQRDYDLIQLLQDPFTGRSIQANEIASWDSSQGGRWLISGTPHFHPAPALPFVRLLEQGMTHSWGKRSLQLIAELRAGGIFLDFGAGIKRAQELAPNAVFIDAVHFPNIDIVNTAPNLPFKADTFDLVISQAVFEHLPNPFHTANEIFRILKPAGKVLIETAFMQPFHADPNHYFNMTIEGLRKLVENFAIIDLEVRPYQMPSDGYIMQIESALPVMKDGPWRQRLGNLLDELRREGRDLDRDLGIVGQRMLAAGVAVVAQKGS